MYWYIFFIAAWLLALLVVPLKRWPPLWPAGLISLALIYMIDTVLISLQAYSYKQPAAFLNGIPLLYWLSSFPGRVLLIHFYPSRKGLQLPYIVLAAFLFLVLELFTCKMGFFAYGSWNPVKSLFLNIFGFISLVWLFSVLPRRRGGVLL